MFEKSRKMVNNFPPQRGRRLPAYLLFAGFFFIFLFTSLACEMGDVLNFPRTLMAPSPTFELIATLDPDAIGVVSVMVDRKLLRIVLDPLGERNIDGVSTAAIEMIEAYLIETIDPLGRYLPSVEILVKDREPVQVVEAVQINNNWQWSFKTGENLPIIPLMKTYAGTVALGSLHQFGAFHGVQFGINLILPIPDEVDDSQIYSIYHTPGNNTFLLIPEGFNAGRGRGLASFAPQGGLFPEYVIFSFVAMPTTSITGFIRAAQSIPVSDYVGIAYSDFLWASLKAKEDKNGLPIGYEHPVGVSEEIVNWLNYDRGFVSAIFFLEHIQEPIPCVEKDALHTVVKQSLPPDTVINGLKDQVTLYVCSEVVSQSKYKTLAYVTNTPTVTGTIPPTSTPAPTRTVTSTMAFTPTKTIKPSNTPRPSSTSPPDSTATTAPTTAPSLTNAPAATTAPTATPPIYDDFTSDPTIFDSNIWTTANSVGGTQDLHSAEKTFYQSVSGSGFPNIYSDEACLLGSAQFRIKTSESNNGSFIIGFVDAGVYASFNIGIFIESHSTSQVSLSTMSFGAKTSTPFSVSNRDTAWHTYLISWTQNPQDYSITVSVSVDDSVAASSTTNAPEIRLNLIVGAMGFGAGDQSSIEIDFIKVMSESCQ